MPNKTKPILIGFVVIFSAVWTLAQGDLAARTTLMSTSQGLLTEPYVVRIYYDEISDLAALQSIDVWEYNNLGDQYVLAAVGHAELAALVKQGWKISIDPSQQFILAKDASEWEESYGNYRTVKELYDDLVDINSTAAGLTEIVTYGQSHCLSVGGCQTPGGDSLLGFPLLALRITNEQVPGSSTINGSQITRGSKPVFFLMANIHAREISTPELAMRFIDYLIDGYGVDADATWLVDHREIWVVPTTNPDGRWLVGLGLEERYGEIPFYQRKNANNDADLNLEADCPVWPPSSYSQYGIDLNRNHSFGWGPLGSSYFPCDLTYRGPSEASELETRALEDLVRALIPDQRATDLSAPAPDDTTGLLITLHSFSNLVLWPWGNSESSAPNIEGLKAIGDKLASFNNYESCQATHCLYATSGSTDDWAYGELGIPAFTFEIGNQFMPPYTEIDAIQWPENRPAFIYAAKIAQQPYKIAHGPDAVDLSITETSSLISLSATIDDRLNGNEMIAAAVYSIDVPPEVSQAIVYPLNAADGIFDSANEEVTGAVNLSSIAPGRHILFVRGQDTSGNWGATSAIFIDVATTWKFEKVALNGFASPGDVIVYQVNLDMTHDGSGQNFDVIISDPLPTGLTLLPESITVNEVPRPDIYDEDLRTLRYSASGQFDDHLNVHIWFAAKVDDSMVMGTHITNTASVEATINGEPVVIPPATSTIPVLDSAGVSYVPVLVGR